MIVHVDGSSVDKVWSLMSPGLSRAITKTSLGKYWDLDSALQRVKSGDLLGFYIPESQYSGLYSFIEYPLCKALFFWWSGKDASNKIPVNFEELDQYLEVIARAYSCDVIECEGRKGWRDILLPLNYREDSILYAREVNK